MDNQLEQFYHKLLTKEAGKSASFAGKVYFHNLYGSAAAFVLQELIGSKVLMVITPDQNSAWHLAQELRFFSHKSLNSNQVLLFSSWETLPYDHFSPHEDRVSERLFTLYQLTLPDPKVVVVPIQALMHRIVPKSYVEANSFVLATGEAMIFETLRNKLDKQGYTLVSKVMEHGEFAVRGSIIDIFPMGSNHPFRIDFLDDIVDSIRVFDIDTQKSVDIIDKIKLLPAKEFLLNHEYIERFCDAWRAHFSQNPLRCSVYQNISEGKSYPGIEYYLPLFFANTETLFDYLPDDAVIVSVDNLAKNQNDFWLEIEHRYEQLRHDLMHPILAPNNIFIGSQQLNDLKEKYCQILINSTADIKDAKNQITGCFKTQDLDKIISGDDVKLNLSNIQHLLKSEKNFKVLFVAQTLGKKELLLKNLQEVKIVPQSVDSWEEFIGTEASYAIIIATIERPLYLQPEKIDKGYESSILVITENIIFGTAAVSIDQPTNVERKRTESLVRDLNELQVGSPIVHIDYGIGRYLGLQKLQTDGYTTEFLVLAYANNAKLYVPVTSLGLVSRYTGVDDENVILSHLGTKQWEKIKQNAFKQVRDSAAELLEIYARRKQASGFIFTKPEEEYKRFTAGFPFAVTPDQQRAIDDVVADMSVERPMDRLICGDVGFGKTEVAMRAAFIGVYNGKQVAILTPTTLLAKQHFDNFVERFAHLPVTLALLSRMAKAKGSKTKLHDLASGKIDIIIGTHKLLQKDVIFKNLGLLIIDEEHRFGVKQKECLKKMATGIDILTLTATPIPRTLNMAFAGVRDFSIIATPPAKRLAIKTFSHEYEPYLIKEAMLREILRGGQVYFLHNNIATIEKTAREIKQLIPEAKIAVAHGQLRKQQLEQIMSDFYHHNINVLVCTTIIESGLDVPSANTIIINRADKFGLAQLHQLRGRVGRSHHQAYAYLIIPPESILTSDAKKRLAAIELMKDLGTGFALATNDLEIRGAGELLGEKQSGVIQGVGFDLYMNMLQRAIKTLKYKPDSQVTAEPIKTEIELPISALIPDPYIASVNLRLIFYKKIAECKDQKELDEIQVEMIDRFGLLPLPTQDLFRLSSCKLRAQYLGLTKITIGASKGFITFAPENKVDLNLMINVLQNHAKTFKFTAANTLEFTSDFKLIGKLELLELLLKD